MKSYELTIVGRRWIDLDDDQDIQEYIDALVDGRGTDIVPDGYNDLNEFLDDMEYDGIEYR